MPGLGDRLAKSAAVRRRVVPLAVALPAVVGVIAHLHRNGESWTDAWLLVSLLSIVVLGALIYWTAASIAKAESKRTRAELAQAERESHYRFLADFIPDQVWTARPDGALDYVNERVLQYFGRSFDEMIGWGWQEVIHPDDLPGVRELWSRSFETGQPYEVEFRLKEAGKSHRWHLGRALAMCDAAGNIVKWFGSNTDIHDQRLAERDYSLVVQTVPEGVWRIDSDQRTVFANRALSELLGHREEDMVGRPVLDFVDPVDQELVRSSLEQRQQGLRGEYEVRLRHRGGELVWARISASPFLDEAGAYDGSLAVVSDIRLRKRGEQREAALHAVTEILAESATLGRAGERILESVCRILGWDGGAIWPVDLERGTLGDGQLWQSGNLARSEFGAESRSKTFEPGYGVPGHVWATAQVAWVADFATAGFPRSGAAARSGIETVVGVPILLGGEVEGVLELVSAERREPDPEQMEVLEAIASQIGHLVQRDRVGLAVQDSEALTRLVLDATGVGICMVDAAGSIVLENELMAIGSSRNGVPEEGSIYAWLAATAGQLSDPAAFRAATERIRDDLEHEGVDEYEVAESGTAYQRYTAPVRNAARAVIGRIFVIRDVTAERSAERAKSELLATVSHEIRTPLASILGFTELLLDRDPDDETRARYLRLSYQEARRLTGLLDDFLDLQRVEQSGLTLAKGRFEIGRLLAQKIDLFVNTSANHTLELDRLPGSLVVRGDRRRIAQVVDNLVSNAIKYSPGGGPVRLAAERRNGGVRVSVSDRGLGIPDGQQEKIFQRFFRVDSTDTRSIGGTGLGLSLAREIVRAHRGEIGFESRERHGSTFWFDLPAPGAPRPPRRPANLSTRSLRPSSPPPGG